MQAQKSKNKQRSGAVSAEAYGDYHKKSEFKPKVINKTQAQVERIKQRLSSAFMFSSLDEKEKEIVIGAMEEV